MKHADVRLQPWQVFYARDEAARRHEEQTRIGARTGTTANVGLDSYTAHEIGAVCELATAVFTGIPEKFFDDADSKAPDLGLIEVRGTRKQDGDLRVYKPDVEKADFMVLAILRECSDAGAIVTLAGWAWSEHAWNYSKPAPFPPHPRRGPARFYSRNSLHAMTTLSKSHSFMEAW